MVRRTTRTMMVTAHTAVFGKGLAESCAQRSITRMLPTTGCVPVCCFVVSKIYISNYQKNVASSSYELCGELNFRGFEIQAYMHVGRPTYYALRSK